MDGRAAFAAGGFLAGAAAVAVACAVTLSNASALADVPGAAADVDVVRVTRATPAVAAPAPSAVAAPVLPVTPIVPAPGATAEIVPAPEPEDIAALQRPAEQVAPPPQRPAAPPAVELSEQQVVGDALRTGSWESLRTWGEQRGWTQEKIDRWIAQLQQRFLSDHQGENADDAAQRSAPTDAIGTEAPLVLETTVPGSQNPGAGDHGEAGKSQQRPQTPAKNAGSPSDRGDSSSHGWKRDQSPKPPHGD